MFHFLYDLFVHFKCYYFQFINGFLFLTEFENFKYQKKNDISKSDHSSEKSFLHILEENFDWYSSEYQSESNFKLNRVKNKLKEISKFKSDENIREEKLKESKIKSNLKFQLDSDEDSSDNCGSRSPLLCRHESLEKDNRTTKTYLYDDKPDKKIPRTYSNDEKNPQKFNKIVRTFSVDEDTVMPVKLKSGKSLPSMEKSTVASLLLTVYDDDEFKDSKSSDKKIEGKKLSEDDSKKEWKSRSGKSIVKRESFLHGNKKLTLTVPINVDEDAEVGIAEKKKNHKDEKRRNEDVLSWSNERVGLDWLFEHTDSETDNTPGKLFCFYNINVQKK